MKIEGIIDHPNDSNDEHFVVGRDEKEAREKAAKKFNVSPDKV